MNETAAMTGRRQFLKYSAASAIAAALPGTAAGSLRRQIATREIPGTGEMLPVVGLGNSNAFRTADREASRALLGILLDHGGAYVDCGGQSRFVVAGIAAEGEVANALFLGNYFDGEDDRAARWDAAQLRKLRNGRPLDLMHAYPEIAVPHWETFRGWKADGVTRYIGVARHRSEYYEQMIKLMKTGTVDFLQVNYSPLETDADKRILPMARDLGVAVTINRPFMNGDYFGLVRGRELPEWAADFDCSSWAQFSLKFILSHPAVNCVLTETANPAHAEDNLGAGLGALPEEATRQKMVTLLQSFT